MSFQLRPAQPEDACTLAELVNIAGEGMPLAFWADQSNVGQDPMEIGQQRCVMEDTTYSYHRITFAEQDGEIAGMLLSYDLHGAPAASDGSVHPMFRPLLRFVTSLGESASISTIAVFKKFRRNGVGSALLQHLESSERGRTGQQALLMTDTNRVGHAFSDGRHYKVVDQAPVIKGTWDTDASNWQVRKRLHS